MIHVECPDCSKSYDVAEELAGKAAKCRDCGGRIPIPQLRTESDTTAERTKPVQPQPAPTKSPSPKATTAVPAKSKPAAKPKPTPKKREEDFFEDDFEEVAEFDDVEEFDDVDEEYEARPRTRSSRNKIRKKKAGQGTAGFSKALETLGGAFSFRVPPLVWLFLGCVLLALTPLVFPAAIVVVLVVSIWGGIGIAIVGSLWSLVVMFRVSTGMAILLIVAGLVSAGFSANGQTLIAAIVNIVSFLINIMVIIGNWEEFRRPVLFYLSGLMILVIGPLLGLVGLFGAFQFANQARPFPVNNAQDQVSNQQGAGAANAPAGNASDSFQIASVPIPEFQDLATIHSNNKQIRFATSSAIPIGGVPGSQMQFTYWEPFGSHEPRSLPCVIVAPGDVLFQRALLRGSGAPMPEDVSQMQPYVLAGFAVLGISLDGAENDTKTNETQAYLKFRDAAAGVINVRNGIEFLTRKVPQVDPQRIFIAGQGTAGSVALLAASYEPRLKGAVSYSFSGDVESRERSLLEARDSWGEPSFARIFPNLAIFARQSSPFVQARRISCPIFLFHAADDRHMPVDESRRLNQVLKSQNKQVKFVEVPTGKRDTPFVAQGIQHAIPWLKELAGMSTAVGAATDKSNPVGVANPATPKGAELPAFPNIAPPNFGAPAAGVLQPSGRAVTFRFSIFSGKGDPAAAARQALRNVSWADPNDIEIDQATSEIRIGQLGGSVNSEPARQALLGAGFQLVGGVSIGAKKPASSTTTEPARPANTEPAVPVASVPAENPFTTKTPPAKAGSKPATPTVTEPAAPKESGPPRRVVTFRYERYSGKGSSINAAVAALKRVKWADPDDIEVDAAKHEIRIGQLEESKEYGPAEKSLKDAGFSLTPGVSSGLRKR